MFSKLKRFLETPKDPQVLVAEIHNEFDTATERLLGEAKDIIAKSDKPSIDKAERLKKLGFSQAQDVVATKNQIENEAASKKLADTILYFRQWYPNNKFINEREVEKICKKYNLVCGEVSNYKGDVPEKNLSEIENFDLRDEDKDKRTNHDDYLEREWDRQRWSALSQARPSQFSRPTYVPNEPPSEIKTRFVKQPLQICAPIKDFDTRTMIVSEGYRLQEIPDPIVLQPVKGGYLIVSKWGLEASDEAVINEKMN